jgi:acyl-coenzyme A synthetase/AMP-(fatty) acid ligase
MVLSGDRVPRAVLYDLARSNATVFPGMPIFYGAPLAAATAEKFRQKFKQPIHSFYGSSECGGICYDRSGMTLENGFVGAPLENVALEMVEPGAESSQIRVRSGAVGEAYFPEPDAKKLGNGVFVPDDLLARHQSGFKIVGRVSDVINVAGKKVNPAEVEAQLLRFAGVRQVVAFGRKSALRNEEVAACVVADSNMSEAELLSYCRTRLSGWQVPKRIFFVDAIPVNERGKTSRRELAAQFAGR